MPSAQTKLDRAIVERYDEQGMLQRMGELPDQLEQAWHMARDIELPIRRDRVDGVVVAGMGGSAIAGDLVRLLAVDHARVPVFVCRDYELPAFAGEQTLVVASSYSGNTEETLSVVHQ